MQIFFFFQRLSSSIKKTSDNHGKIKFEKENRIIMIERKKRVKQEINREYKSNNFK